MDSGLCSSQGDDDQPITRRTLTPFHCERIEFADPRSGEVLFVRYRRSPTDAGDTDGSTPRPDPRWPITSPWAMTAIKAGTLFGAMYVLTVLVLTMEFGQPWLAAKIGAITATLKSAVALAHHRVWSWLVI